MWLCNFRYKQFEETFEKAQWRKAKQMQPVWLCIFSGKGFKETFENAQWRKAKQMQPMWLCLFLCTSFEETFENAQWRKVKQMQPMRLCLLWARQVGGTFEDTQWRKAKQMQPMWLCLLCLKFFEETYEEAQISLERRKGNICHREQTLRTWIKVQRNDALCISTCVVWWCAAGKGCFGIVNEVFNIPGIWHIYSWIPLTPWYDDNVENMCIENC